MDELVKKIRHCATDPMHCLSCGEDKDGRCFKRLMTQAADAIEELSRENKEIMLRANQLEAMNDALIGETGATDALIVSSKPRWIPVTERKPKEELAEFYCNDVDACPPGSDMKCIDELYAHGEGPYPSDKQCRKCWLGWLKEEAEA